MGIFSRFQKPVKEETSSVDKAKIYGENFQLKAELAKITLERDALKIKLKAKEFIDVKIGDPAPVDTEKRALYVAKVAGLHKDVFEPKLKQMISAAHSLLSESNNDREFDQSVKGGIYMLWEILRWGEMMVNEQLSNQTNQNPSLSDEQVNK